MNNYLANSGADIVLTEIGKLVGPVLAAVVATALVLAVIWGGYWAVRIFHVVRAERQYVRAQMRFTDGTYSNHQQFARYTAGRVRKRTITQAKKDYARASRIKESRDFWYNK